MSDHQRILSNRTEDHQVAVSANGMAIFINLMQPPTSVAIARNPHLLSLIKEISAQNEFSGDVVEREFVMQRTVGYLEYATTKPDDVVFYARQLRSPAYTRFIKNRKTEATNVVSMRLERTDDNSYTISNIWIGTLPIPFPGQDNETPDSRSFWESHAVVYNGQPLMASTVTKERPYDDDDTSAQ
jgi:hypothetical protein